MAAGFWLAGQRVGMTARLPEVRHPGSGQLIAHVVPGAEHIERAAASAAQAAPACRALSAAERAAAQSRGCPTMHDSTRVAELITAENGEASDLGTSRGHAGAVDVSLGGRRSTPLRGEVQRLDTDAAMNGRAAIIRRFPDRACARIAPFNFPAQPRRAQGCACHRYWVSLVVVKPSPRTPLSVLLLGEILAETDACGRRERFAGWCRTDARSR